jgi:tight adherence protein C
MPGSCSRRSRSRCACRRAGAGAVGYLTPQILLSNAYHQAPEAAAARLPGRARPHRDLRRVRHVDRGRLQQGDRADGRDLSGNVGRDGPDLGRARLPQRPAPAFENLSERTGLPSFKALATTLLQSERYGTPIANGLRVLAQETATPACRWPKRRPPPCPLSSPSR